MTSSLAHGTEYTRARIQQSGPDGADCPKETALAASVEQRLQRRVFVGAEAAELVVRVSYTQHQREWAADIELLTPGGHHLGQRRIATQDVHCSNLEQSLALVVALMVDLTREEVTARVRTHPTAESTVVRVPAPPERAAEEPLPTQTEPIWSSIVSMSAAFSVEQLPGLGYGARLATELRYQSSWSMEIGISSFFSKAVQDGPSSVARFSLHTADLGGCAVLTVRRLDWSLCGGALVGLERANGSGYRWNRSEQTTQLAPFAKASSTWWPTPRIGLRLSLGTAVSLVRDRFYATRADGSMAPLHRPAFFVPFLHASVCVAL